MKKSLIILYTIFLCFELYSQDFRSKTRNINNSIYLELLGNSPISINFDKTYLLSEKKMSGRIGFSYFGYPGDLYQYVSLPLEINYLKEKNIILKLD